MLSFLFGLLVCGVSKGAIHEVYAAVCWLTSAVCLGAGAVTEAVNRLREELMRTARYVPAPGAEDVPRRPRHDYPSE